MTPADLYEQVVLLSREADAAMGASDDPEAMFLLMFLHAATRTPFFRESGPSVMQKVFGHLKAICDLEDPERN